MQAVKDTDTVRDIALRNVCLENAKLRDALEYTSAQWEALLKLENDYGPGASARGVLESCVHVARGALKGAT